MMGHNNNLKIESIMPNKKINVDVILKNTLSIISINKKDIKNFNLQIKTMKNNYPKEVLITKNLSQKVVKDIIGTITSEQNKVPWIILNMMKKWLKNI